MRRSGRIGEVQGVLPMKSAVPDLSPPAHSLLVASAIPTNPKRRPMKYLLERVMGMLQSELDSPRSELNVAKHSSPAVATHKAVLYQFNNCFFVIVRVRASNRVKGFGPTYCTKRQVIESCKELVGCDVVLRYHLRYDRPALIQSSHGQGNYHWGWNWRPRCGPRASTIGS